MKVMNKNILIIGLLGFICMAILIYLQSVDKSKADLKEIKALEKHLMMSCGKKDEDYICIETWK